MERQWINKFTDHVSENSLFKRSCFADDAFATLAMVRFGTLENGREAMIACSSLHFEQLLLETNGAHHSCIYARYNMNQIFKCRVEFARTFQNFGFVAK